MSVTRMRDAMSDLDELYDELSDLHASKKDGSSRSPLEERIIAGFEDIERFFEQNGHLPKHGEDKDIFERLYAVRLDQIRASAECRAVLVGLDKHGLLGNAPIVSETSVDEIDEDELLAELGGIDITQLKHVKPRAEINAAEEIASRAPCLDFDKFKPLFDAVAKDISNGVRQTRQIRKEAGFLKSQIKVGDFFILYGQTLYIADVGEPIKGSNESMDARLRVIYSNGTESNLLLDSLRRGLYKDETSRILSEPSAGPLFSGEAEEDDISSGIIYVLRSKSENPTVRERHEVLHKIGVTGGSVEKRISIAKDDPTFLMADVEIVATYKLANINRVKLENLIHRFFANARLDVEVIDRFGKPVKVREWFVVPLFVIDELVEKIKQGVLQDYSYDVQSAKLVKAN